MTTRRTGRWLVAAALLAGLGWATLAAGPAQAEDGTPSEGAHAPVEPHGDAHADDAAPSEGAHAAPATTSHAVGEGGHAGDSHAAGEGGHGDGEHGEGGHDAGHLLYSADDDHDGTANWLDGDSEAYVVTDLAFHTVNLGILLAIFFFAFRGPVNDAVVQRAEHIKMDIEAAQAIRQEAAARHAELDSRLAKLDAEIAALETAAREDGEAEEKRIQARADAAARQIADTAQRQIADEAARASRRLRNEAVELAVSLAEGIVRDQLQAADQRRLAEQFLASVDASQTGEA